VRAFEIAKVEWPWMGVMFVWSLNYSVITDAADEKHPWSVLYEDWSPRPSYTALKDMPK
jgi:polysaccharide biosynthesis protein PslG